MIEERDSKKKKTFYWMDQLTDGQIEYIDNEWNAMKSSTDLLGFAQLMEDELGIDKSLVINYLG